MNRRSILITGCSSGIGLASARAMKARGWRVFATARKAQDIARLRDEVGVESLYLDYAEPRSIAEAAEKYSRPRTASRLRSSTTGPTASLVRSRT
jgi:NADP-dependent 3-hydroxy acid dehydrogenase YdfG